ncbi:hypothetical protein [Sphingosinithalassobacter sp. CS137]|uniref:hypothetical protein n=1 Tax=Sphingosinithalassobacter sp. CS137 TaxID=2762748 RepID=UPI0021D2588D|nr:hypothetical protein [Sphingosinithalassobacter sp. CS137]
MIFRFAGRLLLFASAGLLVGTAAVRSAAPQDWWAPGDGRTFPAQVDYRNEQGVLRVLLANGPLDTRDHPFFAPPGANGRACVTCHQPADAMSLSVESARERWEATGGRDQLFSAYDGSNCPTLPQGERASHSLLLDHGLIRIQLPWPVTEWNGRAVEPDFTIEVVRDPYGCNSGEEYGPAAGNVSVYRRPRPVANLKYLIATGFAYDPKQGLPLPLDPVSGRPMSGNLMADGRSGTLGDQMRDAAATHLQLLAQMDAGERDRIEEFILRVYAAQQFSSAGGALDAGGAEGGPRKLADSEPGQLGSIGTPLWSEFEAWERISDAERVTLSPEALAFRQSVARGARVFRDKTFLITDSAGINAPIGFGNPVRNSCVFCHNMTMMGNDVAPGQVDLGTTTQPFADPAPHLPLFRITCTGRPHPFYGRVIHTSDPGFALTTGRCADVGKITLQSMRGLAARAPYFSNGSASDLRGVVDYYDRRYDIGYTEQEKQDLVNLMSVL